MTEQSPRTDSALALAEWATTLQPTERDLELADAALLDTVAVGCAAVREPILGKVAHLDEGARWAVACHILDFDDLHMPSTTHISTVCVPAALATNGGAAAYLAGAGVMARLGTMLGWGHYSAGWHATATTGVIAAAVVASAAAGADADRTARAISLAVSSSGGVQRAFGTDAKSVQVGLCIDSGIRAAALAGAGVSADLRALDDWLELVGATGERAWPSTPAVPDGLAVKMFPCCYALQRPIQAVSALRAQAGIDPADVRSVRVATPAATVRPLIHHRPKTGLEGKFSLEYAIATALLDPHQGFAAFTDEAVLRPEAQRIIETVETSLSDEGDWLLYGSFAVEVELQDGTVHHASLDYPLGSPRRPVARAGLLEKAADCLRGTGLSPDELSWGTGAQALRAVLG